MTDLYQIEIEQKQRQIHVLIETKEDLDALDLAHAVMFRSHTFQTAKPSFKVNPKKCPKK
jgi:hypothetical protein